MLSEGDVGDSEKEYHPELQARREDGVPAPGRTDECADQAENVDTADDGAKTLRLHGNSPSRGKHGAIVAPRVSRSLPSGAFG